MAKATSPRANDPNDELKTLRARVAKLEAREEKYKKAAETFRDAERRFRQLAAAASEGVVISEAGIILDANDQFARIFGYKRAELVGTSMLDLVVPEDRDAVRGHVAEMFEGRYEYRGVRRDGAVLTLEVRGKPIPYEGRTVRITAIADVTERKRADEGLRASEQRYRRLFEAARDGVLILDAATGKIIDANPFLTQILGYTRKDLIGKELWEIGVLADNWANRLAFAELQRDKYIRYEDLPLQAKDGHIVDVEFVSNVYQVGGQEVIQCNIRDISERKAAEDALRDAEARLRAVITNTPVVLYALDENGTFTLFEGAGARAEREAQPILSGAEDNLLGGDRHGEGGEEPPEGSRRAQAARGELPVVEARIEEPDHQGQKAEEEKGLERAFGRSPSLRAFGVPTSVRGRHLEEEHGTACEQELSTLAQEPSQRDLVEQRRGVPAQPAAADLEGGVQERGLNEEPRASCGLQSYGFHNHITTAREGSACPPSRRGAWSKEPRRAGT